MAVGSARTAYMIVLLSVLSVLLPLLASYAPPGLPRSIDIVYPLSLDPQALALMRSGGNVSVGLPVYQPVTIGAYNISVKIVGVECSNLTLELYLYGNESRPLVAESTSNSIIVGKFVVSIPFVLGMVELNASGRCNVSSNATLIVHGMRAG